MASKWGRPNRKEVQHSLPIWVEVASNDALQCEGKGTGKGDPEGNLLVTHIKSGKKKYYSWTACEFHVRKHGINATTSMILAGFDMVPGKDVSECPIMVE